MTPFRKLYYMGLESYESRYTLQLTDWNRRAFRRLGVDWVEVPGSELRADQKISVGQVLDAHGRSYFAMSQMQSLVHLMQAGEVTAEDVVYFEDMFQPGIEALPYIMDQIPVEHRPRVYVRCLAQSIDPDDFTQSTGMARWMRHYEQMACGFVTAVLASSEEMVAHLKIAGWTVPIYNVSGLAFDADEVRERAGVLPAFADRPLRVGFAARWDAEKQPHFFMDLVERVRADHPHVTFSLFQGGELRSNDPSAIVRARSLQERGWLEIHEGLSKAAYYQLLGRTRVLFNCALQDWVSNTVSEADALGCNVLFPAYRSFPETFANDATRLYVPWSLREATAKLLNLLAQPHRNGGRISQWTGQTVDRIVSIMRGTGEEWNRSGLDYRRHVATAKYTLV